MAQIKQHPFRVIESDGSPPVREVDAPDHVDHIGVFLREARMATGRNIADIAASLNIRVRFLQAIEDGRYEDLPGHTYATGFVRSYADYLGLDTKAMVAQFKNETKSVTEQIDLTFPAPAPAGWSPTGKLVTTCVILAAVLFGGWYYLQKKDAVDVATVPAPSGPNVAVAAKASDADAAAQRLAGEPQSDATGDAAVSPVAPSDQEATDPYHLPTPISSLVTADPLATPTAHDKPSPNREEDRTLPVAASAPTAAPAQLAPAVTAAGTPQATKRDDAASGEDEPAPELTNLAAATQAPEASEPPAVEPPVINPAEVKPANVKPVAATPAEAKPVEVKPVEATSIEGKPIEPRPVEAAKPVETKPAQAVARSAPPQPVATQPAAPQSAAPQPPVQIATMSATGALGETIGTNGGGRTFGVTNQHARVVIGVRAESWVQVLDGNQNVMLTRMLRPGDRYLVPDRDDLVMLTGNAGGLIITVDGKEVPRIGSDGAILHNVRLNVDLLKAGRAVIE